MKIFPPAKSAFWIYLLIITVIGAIVGYHFLTGYPKIVMAGAGLIAAGTVLLILTIALPFVHKYLNKIPQQFLLASLAFVAVFNFIEQEYFRLPAMAFYVALTAMIVCGIVWEVGWNWSTTRSGVLHKVLVILPIAFILGTLVYLVLRPGVDSQDEKLPSDYYGESTTEKQLIPFKKLLEPGGRSFEVFTYGSGYDKNRLEYSDEVRFTTQPVDASLLLPEWDSIKQEHREKFLGYGISELPLNARVYLPEGDGPFPLVVIVHGNHSMIDWSDGGYAYLGEYLASRGIITVSVDENFLNGHWSGDFRGKEMPARAWILLKHLEQLKNWNKDASHELFGKIDMGQVVLAGHSRGGETVQIAAVFNNIERFPENGNEVFNFGFSIKGVISIAPTDYRYDRQVSMKNVNYLSLQGSYDSDESSFWGMRAYRRLTFTDSLDYFKAGVYIHRANHSQFNSDWGRSDAGIPYGWFLNRGALINDFEQQELAKFYITGFLEKVLDRENVPDELFTNVGTYRALLPDTYILTHFSTSKTKPLIQFGEDADILRADKSIRIEGQDLLIWKESDLKSRDDESLQNYGLTLGWHGDSSKMKSKPAFYKMTSDSMLFKEPFSAIQLVLGTGNFKELKPLVPDSLKLKEPEYNLTLKLIDVVDKEVTIQLNDVKKIAPRLFSEFGKVESINESLGEWEVQTESFHISAEELKANNPAINLDSIKSLTLQFDQVPYGVVVVDEIAYTTLD